jgi:hypothetical protein
MNRTSKRILCFSVQTWRRRTGAFHKAISTIGQLGLTPRPGLLAERIFVDSACL